MRQEARGAGGRRSRNEQRQEMAERGVGGRKEEGAPRGYPREGAGKFFPLGCRQKGNYFNCGQPRSTKLHPVFLLPLSLCLCLPLAFSPRPRVRLLTLILSLSYAASPCVIFLPHSFSLLRFVGEHIPSLATVTAGVSRLARVCLPSWKLTHVSLGSRSSSPAFVYEIHATSVEIIDMIKHISYVLHHTIIKYMTGCDYDY